MVSQAKALFLDRDGVINVEKNYLHKIEEVEFVEGIFELCAHFQEAGYLIIVITNQSGIARGMYGEKDFEIITAWMINVFKSKGITITAFYHCPHHPQYSGECECRKPKPKMLLDAAEKYHIDMSASLFVGDSERDIEAAQRAGVGEQILLSSNLHVNTKASRVIKELQCLF